MLIDAALTVIAISSTKEQTIMVQAQASTMVRLDFGEYGKIDIPPEVAMQVVSNQKIKDKIRTEAVRAHRARLKVQADEVAKGVLTNV